MFGDPKERLPAILENSRKYQNVVSTQLAGQVLESLYELLRGFQSADDQTKGELLRDILARDPDHVYAGLLTTLLRLVFLLYAEDRGLVSTDSVYANYYSVAGLYERLRADAGRYPDTMYQRYGAWAQLLALFRLIYEGGSHGGMRIPPREGYLFDPDRYPYLEGRRNRADEPAIPRVPDGVLYQVLSKLMVLDGERLSYRTLAVEQIGSVYETIMGFELHVAAGRCIAIKPAKKHGAPAAVDLEELLSVAPDKRQKWIADNTDQKLTGQAADALKSAKSIDDLLAALERRIARAVTPNVVPKGAMIFQPSGERRRSGSHYTPSTLTGPIVEAALRPVLRQLGEDPTPDQILNLKVCDPAMGSGAFLVEACRQLAEVLVLSWHKHDEVPPLPPDENELLLAMRMIAQRCLYGVDKNPLAADLAKLSLWLATLAKDHPFTFVDHALRSGDSLIGFNVRQISYFHWSPEGQKNLFGERFEQKLDLVLRNRAIILDAPDSVPYETKRQQLAKADEYLTDARMAGDALAAAFFSGTKPKDREQQRTTVGALVKRAFDNIVDLDADAALRAEINALNVKGVTPFHWEIEFPEVFRKGGFDVIVGNPPFAGKNTLIEAHADGYLDWLKTVHEQSHGNSDLVAHFFRRAFTLLRPDGCSGLIATNTIGQGDTRSTGLRWICTHGGTIYQARKRLKWPGQAAVVVSVVHVARGAMGGPYSLDNREVPVITAYLFHAGTSEDPMRLKANEGKSFIGCFVLGIGFTFDDTEKKGVATSLDEMAQLIEKDPRNHERIFPYIGGEEVTDSPTHAHHRYVINFDDFPLRRENVGANWGSADVDQRRDWLRVGIVPMDYPEPVAADWPALLDIVERKVRPERLVQNDQYGRKFWWRFLRTRPEMQRALKGKSRFLAAVLYSPHLSLVYLPSSVTISHKLCALPFENWNAFALLQCRVHEVWARTFSATLKDDLAYAPSDCFETFPFPPGFETDSALEHLGCGYYEFRAQLMQRERKGLTTIYNWFHDPESECPDIPRLRELHEQMDRVVLDAYGWTDIPTHCEFIPEFDDEADEDENGRPRRKKYRYRWPDDVRDEVLARLLELNRQRALEEGQLPTTQPVFADTIDAGPKAKRRKSVKRPAGALDQGILSLQEGEA
ncbi:MAG: N-6 DNA methylase [Bryobacterales bacterium]|nr:N-6 DNA methylase [Bryobacterales bacterium]